MANEIKKRDVAVYKLGRDFLLDLLKKRPGIENPAQVLDRYLKPERMENLNDIFMRLVESAKNRNRMNNYITSIITDTNNLRDVLLGFNPSEVSEKYFHPEGWKLISEDLLGYLKKKVKRKVLWRTFCKAIVSGANFLSHFENKGEFEKWVNQHYDTDEKRASLARFIGEQIDGFRIALACDFLKEVGFIKFGKPDVYLKEILRRLNLCANTDDDIEVINAISRIAQNNEGTTPFSVDKTFWLIGSGNFYKHDFTLGRNIDKFIKYVKRQRPDLF